MEKDFTLNDKNLVARSHNDGDVIQIAVFDGDRRIYTLEMAVETLADMTFAPAAAGTTVGKLVDMVIADLERKVDEELLRL